MASNNRNALIAMQWIEQNPEAALNMAQHALANRQAAQRPAAMRPTNEIPLTVATPDVQDVLSAFRQLDSHAHNIVAIADLKDATGLPLDRLHRAINDLRRTGVMTVANYEGRHGADRRVMDASIRERDELLAFVMLRTN